MIKEREIKFIAEKIAKKYKPEKIILFGSFAWGKPTEDSDIDLLIIKDTRENFFERNMAVRNIINGIIPVDVLVYTPEEIKKNLMENGNLFLEDVVRNGVIIYSNPQKKSFIPTPKRPLKILH